MPSETPIRGNESTEVAEIEVAEIMPEANGHSEPVPLSPSQDAAPVVRGSHWIDYDTHELLQMISELEDERRWARLREGIWIAILVHLALLSALTWIPRYIFHVPPVVDPIDAIQKRKDLTYLDMPPDVLKQLQPKVEVKPVPTKPPVIDKKTLDEMNKQTPPPPMPETAPPAATPAPPQPAPPVQQSQQSILDAPHPQAVPVRPNPFAFKQSNPLDQLHEAMKGAGRASGSDNSWPSSLSMHPGAGSGGVQILSDTQGIDFSSYIRRTVHETERTWDPLLPDEVNPPLNKSGTVMIRFKILPNGRVMEGSMVLEGRSGDTALDRSAWGAITGSNYPPLPKEFHGPYLELRYLFECNTDQR